jgi:ABC-type sugar transport system permease subunit
MAVVGIDTRRGRARFRPAAASEALLAYAFLGPALALMAVFLAYPILDTFYLSFTRYNFVYDDHPTVLGLNAYRDLFARDDFRTALLQTAQFTGLFLPAFVAGGLLAAVVIEALPRFGGLFQTAIFLPVIVGTSVSGVMFTWILDGQFGLANHLLLAAGLGTLARNWLTEPPFVLPAIATVSLWKQLGIAMLIFLAGLRAIPQDIYDAAHVDGAGPIRAFFSMTLPNLRPSLVITTVWGIVQSIKVFDLPFVMTHGGPGGASETLYLRLWEAAFKDYEMGRAASIGYIIAILILACTAVTFWSGRAEAAA